MAVEEQGGEGRRESDCEEEARKDKKRGPHKKLTSPEVEFPLSAVRLFPPSFSFVVVVASVSFSKSYIDDS